MNDSITYFFADTDSTIYLEMQKVNRNHKVKMLIEWQLTDETTILVFFQFHPISLLPWKIQRRNLEPWKEQTSKISIRKIIFIGFVQIPSFNFFFSIKSFFTELYWTEKQQNRINPIDLNRFSCTRFEPTL